MIRPVISVPSPPFINFKILGYPKAKPAAIILSAQHVVIGNAFFAIPALFLFGFDPDPRRFFDPVNLGNLVFLGLGASALCFVTWNYAVKILGAVRTSVYIYLTPAVTVIMAFLMLLAGMALTLAGLVVSERK